MKAIRVYEFGSPEVLKYEDVPTPQVDRQQVLVKIHAVGVNPVDTYIRSGSYALKPDLPYTPGMDAAGVIEKIGERVSNLSVGDRVYTSQTLTGAYAEYALCTPEQLHPLPDNTSFEQGAAINIPYVTAYRALFQRGRAVPSEKVLIHGASGGVGLAAVQFAVAAGLEVIATVGSSEGRKLVEQSGAHHILDHTSSNYLESVKELTAGHGVDLILEMLANVNLAKDLSVLARGGRVVVIGSRGTVEITPRELMSREGDILGMSLFNATQKDLNAAHAAIYAGLLNHTLRPVVGRTLPLAEAALAHKIVIESRALGKLVLIP
ncbi:MAG: NADPH:quinone reductase [Acidobacteriota bacterium]|nr:NADPH:quinone reductase [Blastocatellia bacterium]MDW8413544.1 NADPH:quinone reductase [Acidobacteriota bacterium]